MNRKEGFYRVFGWMKACALVLAIGGLVPLSAYAQAQNQPADLKNDAEAVAPASAESAAATAPARPNPAAPPGGWSWSGFYAGGHLGYGWGRANTSFTPLPSAATFINLAPTTLQPDPSGIIGGGQVGFNWQAGVWVFGGEFDFSGSNMDGTRTVTPIIQNNGTPFPGAGFISAHQDTDWISTLRPRLGVTPVPRLLLYGTAGLAFGRVNYSAETDFRPFGTVHYPASFTKTNSGWTAGGGAEVLLNASWSVKGEYLFYDLGNEAFTANPTPALPPFQVAYNWETRAHTFKVGVNFHF